MIDYNSFIIDDVLDIIKEAQLLDKNYSKKKRRKKYEQRNSISTRCPKGGKSKNKGR